MEEVLKIILATIGAAGGTGAIIFLALRFSVNKLSERMSQKYQLKLDKELERYKNELEIDIRKLSSKLENKNHISKALFDIQLDFYKQLSDKFFNVVLCANTLIPPGVHMALADKNLQKKKDEEDYANLNKAAMEAQRVLNSSMPFITSEQYEAYNELLVMAREHIFDFNRRWCLTDLSPQSEKETLPVSAYERSNEMSIKFKKISNDLHVYLSSLIVVD